MKNRSVILLLLIFGLTMLGNFLFVFPAFAAIELVKSADFGTVYYIDSRGVRHAFPNEITYTSWYGGNFSKIVIVSNNFLSNYPLGNNITIRPGTYLVKIKTAPQVYAVEQGGVLRELQSESIASAIYGEDWPKRVVDVPDVFFDDYILGEPIIHDYSTPDSILYQDEKTKKYYYKNDNILRLFEDEQAVLDNNFNLDQAISRERGYYIRQRPIVGLDKNVFNLVAEPITDTRDCENKKLKAAFIFLADKEYAEEEVKKLHDIKKAIPDRFSYVTSELSEIDVDYPTAIFFDDGYFLQKRNDGTTDIKNEVINSFYDNNPDVFDFIFVWTNFKIPSENTNEIAHFSPVNNKQEGINRPMLSRGEIYGSTGKLKGVIVMGNINKYDASTSHKLNEVLNLAMHEILHNWAAYVDFIDQDGNESQALLRDDDYQHWNYYAGFISPLGGSGWIDNGDGTFTNGLTKIKDSNLRQYSQLDLYLMGLIPAQLMDPIMYLEPTEAGAIGNIIAAEAKYITIDQIIKACGKIKCSLD